MAKLSFNFNAFLTLFNLVKEERHSRFYGILKTMIHNVPTYLNDFLRVRN